MLKQWVAGLMAEALEAGLRMIEGELALFLRKLVSDLAWVAELALALPFLPAPSRRQRLM